MLVVPLVIGGFFGVMGVVYSGPPTESERSEKFIVVNPLDLSQIKGLSKYRSCVGHDYRDPNLDGKKESTPRSMKHYIKVKEELAGKNGVIKAIAPFDGKISNLEKRDPERKPYDQQVWLTPATNPASPRRWNFIFFHIDLNDDLGVGSPVKAGQVIGTAYMTRGPENTTDNFDMAVKFTRPMAVPAVSLPLAHASEEVLAQYREYGVELSSLEIAEAVRDQQLCPTTGGSLAGDVYFSPTSDPSDWAFLTKRK